MAVAVVAVAVVAAGVLRRRQRGAVPTQPAWATPVQLDRADFPGGSPWLVAVFSSASCAACADVMRTAAVLGSDQVTVTEIEYSARRDLHTKYSIDAVPLVVVADELGVVHRSFVGPVTAADLWSAVAQVRQAQVRQA